MSTLFRKATILICSCILAVSCVDDIVTCNSYILGFYEYDQIAANSEYVDVGGTLYARVNIYVPKAHMVTDVFGDRPSENGTYMALCGRFGDTGFEERKLNPDENRGEPTKACYPSQDISRIYVSCGSSWDGSHPEGASLEDITRFEGVSVYPYIMNDYKEFDYKAATLSDCFNHVFVNARTFNRYQFYPVDKPLAELSQENLLLLGAGVMTEPGGVFYPERDMLYYYPDVYENEDRNSWNYNMFTLFIPAEDTADRSLTVTLRYKDGSELSTSLTVSD